MCLIIIMLLQSDQIEVGYELTMYATSEDQEIVRLNIVIHKPNSGQAPRPFSLTVTTSDGTAGIYLDCFYCDNLK